MSAARSAALAGAVAAGALVAAVVPASADVGLAEGDRGSLTLGGYVRTLSGAQVWSLGGGLELIAPELDSNPLVGMNVGVARLEWTATIGDRLTLDLHQRVLWRLTSQTILSEANSAFGVGVTAAPPTTVALRTILVDENGAYAEHDIDRLSARLYFDRVDLYLGRQALAWGNSVLFPVADVWTRYAPFELDMSERRGVDGARLIWGPALDKELEFVLVDRGRASDLGGGLRATFYRERADVYAALAKTYDELVAAGGWVRDIGQATVRGEVMLPVDLDDDGTVSVNRPRSTVGIGHLRPDWYVAAEYHYNGAGVVDAADYVTHASSSEVYQRGEVYLVGRHYLGGTVAYNPTELVTIGLGGVLNVADPSAVLTPTFAWQLAQDVELAAGAFVPVGEGGELVPVPHLGSEFGSAPVHFYAQIVAYY